MATFRLNPEMPPPAGDQPRAIEELVESIEGGELALSLLGVTGSGKTRTMAGVMERLGRPALVMAPNKTLAAQLTNEFKELFPDTAVEYFVSYYDYYQPEAYIPQSDTYIEKDSSMNEEIDRLRHSATSALLTRRDVIIVASVSAIYGLGSPEEYREQMLFLEVGEEYDRDEILRKLVDIHYDRNDLNFVRGKFRVRGDTLEVFPAYEERAMRIELFGDQVERILVMDPVTGEIVGERDELLVFPASHYVAGSARMERAIAGIEAELAERLAELEREGKLLEAQRLRMRTTYDLEMLREVGVCNGIENYSRHIDGRSAGTPPFTLLDYFPDDFVLFVDESHVTVPQIGGMYEGDRSRKVTLVEHGFGGAAHQGSGRRPDPRDQAPRRQGPAHPGHHPDQEDGRGPHRLPARDGPARALPALRDRHGAAHRDPPRPAARRIRRADRHQPAARGPRPSMRRAIDETNRRRKLQIEYNQANGIDPQTIRRRVTDIIQGLRGEEEGVAAGGRPRKGRAPTPARGRAGRRGGEPAVAGMPKDDLVRLITSLEEEMHEAAKDLRFEYAARLRDEVADLRRELRVMTEVGVG